MGDLIDINPLLQKQRICQIINEMENMYGKAGEIMHEYTSLMQRDFSEGLKQFPSFLYKVRNINNLSYEALAGGPNHDWTCPLINIVGNLYSILKEEERTRAAKIVLNYLDGINSDYAQNHVERIHEPWLVRDIVINRWLYWPGFEEYSFFLKENPTQKEFRERVDTAKSKAWFSLAVMYSKGEVTLDLRQSFYKDFPNLVDRTLDFIAARIKHGAETFAERKGISQDIYVEEHLQDYDISLHFKIKEKIAKAKWVIIE